MSFKTFAVGSLIGAFAVVARYRHGHARLRRGVDVQTLTPTRSMSEEEKAERYRLGRFAEIGDDDD